MIEAPLSLIETFRFEPEEGFVHLDLHRARMRRSADALSLPFEDGRFDEALARAPRSEGSRRVRMELGWDGRMTLTHAPFAPLAEETVWRVALAERRLSSNNPLIRHKTSRRAVYDSARGEYPIERADEVLLLNERGEICEGTITSLFLPDGAGRLLTPPLSCGLLAGVLREQLIAEGRAREEIIRPLDLAGRPFFVGNSLRGLIAARIVENLS